MFDNIAFGKRLKEIRAKAEKTQAEFAKTIGVTAASVSAWESGVKKPNIDVAFEIAEKFNVSIDWLCGKKVRMKGKEHENRIYYSEIYEIVLHLYKCGILDITFSQYEDYEPDMDTGYARTIVREKADVGFQEQGISAFIKGIVTLTNLYKTDVLPKDVYETSIQGLKGKDSTHYIDTNTNKIMVEPFTIGDFDDYDEIDPAELPF